MPFTTGKVLNAVRHKLDMLVELCLMVVWYVTCRRGRVRKQGAHAAVPVVQIGSVRVMMKPCIATSGGFSARRLVPSVATSGLALALSGCGEVPPSPSMFFFGAYFPSWMLCVCIGIIGALVVRAVLVRVGIDDELPVRLLVYVSLAAAIGFASALAIYGL